ncbi:hypothetical protein GDO86_001994 [Hymenochirus boettgeri]|uniref:Scavenger receptor class B member 1 n=1 Tax=Hymenochirus boettgeri TaxID=247094 RepID=A0A8T2KNR3_9PIPI|nr:hypothetical protein GDO86_001994 [Hymenochirus boettgeri]
MLSTRSLNCSVSMRQTGKIKPVILPILWFAESGYLEGPVYYTYYNMLILVPTVLDYLQYIFIALGAGFILIALVLPFINQDKCFLFWNSNKKIDESQENKAQKEKLTAPNPNENILLEAKL